jgi:hypothetical protein
MQKVVVVGAVKTAKQSLHERRVCIQSEHKCQAHAFVTGKPVCAGMKDEWMDI